jgi:HlyD family secretion protein
MSRSRLIIGIVVVIALVALGSWGYQNYLAPVSAAPTATRAEAEQTPEAPSVVSAEGKIIPLRDATLAFRVSGRVAAIPVKEGEVVKAGAVLIQLEDADLKAAVAQARAAVDIAQAQLDLLKAGPRPEEIAAAEAQVKAANSAVGQAVAQRDDVSKGATPDQIKAAEAQVAQAEAERKQAWDAYNSIVNSGMQGDPRERAWLQWQATEHAKEAALAALEQIKAGASQQAIRALNSAIGVTAGQRDAANAQLELIKAGARPEQIAAAQAQVDQAKAALEAAQAQLAQTTLRAPFAGTVVRLSTDVGEIVTPGAPILVLADLAQWRLQTTDLSETDVVLVRPGQKAIISLDAFKDQTFAGIVTEISDTAETNRGNTTYPVTLALDPTEAALRWGMTAFVDIEVKP